MPLIIPLKCLPNWHPFFLKQNFHYPHIILHSPNKCGIDFLIIRMASFCFFRVLIVPLMIYYPLLSSSTQLNSKTSNYLISTSPAVLANPPSPSPFQELPPDIAPLLPSPGGVLPSPTVSSVPTIPSTPSPPDPDGVVAPGPGSAFSPLGALPASSASPRSLMNFAVAAGFIAYWSV
ncbi:hydroxyproline-rich glycoprotein [Salix suchowensis]|nr:hydroxyproline-rich glycoprotein [Salix suchowensis]